MAGRPVSHPPIPRWTTAEDDAAAAEIDAAFGADVAVTARHKALEWMVPVSWVGAALCAAVDSGKPGAGWNYIHGIVRRYRAQGRPDVRDAPVPTSAATAARSRPGKPMTAAEQIRQRKEGKSHVG